MSEINGFGRSAASPSLTSPTLASEPATPSAVPANRVLVQRGDYNMEYLAELADRLLGLAAREGAALGSVNFNGEVRQYSRLIRQAASFLNGLVDTDRMLAAEDGSQSPPASDGEGISEGDMPTEPNPSNHNPQAPGEPA